MYFVTLKNMPANSYIEAKKRKGKALFVPFVVLGDPDRERSVEIIHQLVDNGADALELGLPFSDPPADGPVIQQADTRALTMGIRIDDCFKILKEVRGFTDIPIGLLVYYNLVLQRGVEQFYRDCAETGVDSVLIADLPLEHAEEVVSIAKAVKVAPVFLVSEVTTEERMVQIARVADGYLYVVSYLGVTGVAHGVLEEKIRETIQRARKHTSLPLIVGFGVNTAEQVAAAARAGADGVIVGSRIVREIPENLKAIPALCAELASAITPIAQ